MSLRKKYQVTATIKRQTVIGNKSNYETVATIKGQKQPLSNTYIGLVPGNFSKSSLFWVDVDADILEGDQAIIDSDTYYVHGETKYDIGTTRNQHKEMLIELKDV